MLPDHWSAHNINRPDPPLTPLNNGLMFSLLRGIGTHTNGEVRENAAISQLKSFGSSSPPSSRHRDFAQGASLDPQVKLLTTDLNPHFCVRLPSTGKVNGRTASIVSLTSSSFLSPLHLFVSLSLSFSLSFSSSLSSVILLRFVDRQHGPSTGESLLPWTRWSAV